jgi:hypothetical protein
MTTTQTKSKIEGRVAQILNSRELAINIGADKGVKLGMVFAVLAETPLEVRDPETKEVLDVVDREKVRVMAGEVRKKITICRTYRVRKIGGGPLYGLSSIDILRSGDLFAPPKEVPETLEATNESYPPPLLPEESYVKINDRVVLVSDD